ncbi:MAG: ATP-dependent Clp protease proteolytic subunit [Clostridia bacterium]|nr:ATP-dependent Clp protease proteolytic subunit [Clostridia bacterium]
MSSPAFQPNDFSSGNSDCGVSEAISNIIETGSITVRKGDNVIHCLTVIGQVEGHYILPAQNKTTKYEHVIPQLVAIEESDGIDGLILILNTVGGDIEAGLAIAELISGMKTPTVSLVLGGGHSIGVPLAVSADRSFITPSATMTVHPVRMNGLVLGVPQTLSYFEQMQERIVRFVSDNSRISPDRFRELMLATGELVLDVGTVLEGSKAVEEGLIDSIGSLSDALECLYEMIENNKKNNNKTDARLRKDEEINGRHKQKENAARKEKKGGKKSDGKG